MADETKDPVSEPSYYDLAPASMAKEQMPKFLIEILKKVPGKLAPKSEAEVALVFMLLTIFLGHAQKHGPDGAEDIVRVCMSIVHVLKQIAQDIKNDPELMAAVELHRSGGFLVKGPKSFQ